jgi:large subunit ribosomal protein L13
MKKEIVLQRKYYLFDCEADNFGRIATRVATILQGKHKADYVPNQDRGDNVVLVNISKIRFSGNKAEKKMYYSFSGYPGGITSRKLSDLIKNDPERIVFEAVYNMLPKNKLRDKMIKKLVTFRDENHGMKVDFKKGN